MSEGWKPGDLALCVRNDSDTNSPAQAGWVGTVSAVWVDRPGWVLLFKEITPQSGYSGFVASAFRRIPPHTPDAEDAEVIALLNGAGVKEPVT